ncbi:general odorant-binding protein 28a isoform X2 [Anabrus simplex]|uniref:general odorant-binding protein 28a isoform X2 n=1 Tax=Anabrus simplex TaxID=316456 RepID=UPI0034DD2FC1
MKSFLASLVVVAATFAVGWGASSESFRAVVEPTLKICKTEVVGVTEVDANNVLHREELTTRAGKCLQMCVYEKLGGMKNGAMVTREEALRVLHRVYDGDVEKLNNATAKVDMCGDVVLSSKLTDGCEIANVIQQCFRRLH